MVEFIDKIHQTQIWGATLIPPCSRAGPIATRAVEKQPCQAMARFHEAPFDRHLDLTLPRAGLCTDGASKIRRNIMRSPVCYSDHALDDKVLQDRVRLVMREGLLRVLWMLRALVGNLGGPLRNTAATGHRVSDAPPQ